MNLRAGLQVPDPAGWRMDREDRLTYKSIQSPRGATCTKQRYLMNKSSRHGFAWRWAALALSALLALAGTGPAQAASDDATPGWTGAYAGLFAGSGWVDNRSVDVDGFANWGHPGWKVDYDDSGFVAGALAGRKFEMGGARFRVEIDGMSGDLSATSNKLDPEGLDETVKSEFRWIATARAGMEKTVGPATVFATGGMAISRIANSVTDIDCCADGEPPRVDPDDSFRDSSTEVGWMIGAGVEAPLAEAWTLRVEGTYLDFGRSTHYVNRSGNNRCGPGNPGRPCPYKIENKFASVRLAIIHRFGL